MINTDHMIAKKPFQHDLHIVIRNIYGVNKAYPACSHAENFTQIAGTKTLTAHTLKHACRLGYHLMLIDSVTGIDTAVSYERISTLID